MVQQIRANRGFDKETRWLRPAPMGSIHQGDYHCYIPEIILSLEALKAKKKKKKKREREKKDGYKKEIYNRHR